MFRIPSFKIEVKFEAESWIEKITVTLQTFIVFRVKSKVGATVKNRSLDLFIYLFTQLLLIYIFICSSIHLFLYFIHLC